MPAPSPDALGARHSRHGEGRHFQRARCHGALPGGGRERHGTARHLASRSRLHQPEPLARRRVRGDLPPVNGTDGRPDRVPGDESGGGLSRSANVARRAATRAGRATRSPHERRITPWSGRDRAPSHGSGHAHSSITTRLTTALTARHWRAASLRQVCPDCAQDHRPCRKTRSASSRHRCAMPAASAR